MINRSRHGVPSVQRESSVATQPILPAMRSILTIQALSITTALLFTAQAARAQSADELIKRGDAFDLKFQASAALNCYLPVGKMEPDNAHVIECIARQYRHLMTDTSSCDEKLRLGRPALQYSKRAAALAPDDSDAQLSSAITYGKMLPFQDKKEQTQCCPLIKAAAEKAIKLAKA